MSYAAVPLRASEPVLQNLSGQLVCALRLGSLVGGFGMRVNDRLVLYFEFLIKFPELDDVFALRVG